MLKFVMCFFIAKEGGKRERGVAQCDASDNVMGIIDANGELVEAPVWTYDLLPHEQCATFNMHPKKLQVFFSINNANVCATNFTDWFEFADWVKNYNEQNIAVVLHRWTYV